MCIAFEVGQFNARPSSCFVWSFVLPGAFKSGETEVKSLVLFEAQVTFLFQSVSACVIFMHKVSNVLRPNSWISFREYRACCDDTASQANTIYAPTYTRKCLMLSCVIVVTAFVEAYSLRRNSSPKRPAGFYSQEFLLQGLSSEGLPT